MQPIATDVARVCVCVCVCLSVCLSVCVLITLMYCAKHNWTDQDAVWGLTHAGPRNHVLHEVRDPHEIGQFCGLSGPLEIIGSLLWYTQQKGLFNAQ